MVAMDEPQTLVPSAQPFTPTQEQGAWQTAASLWYSSNAGKHCVFKENKVIKTVSDLHTLHECQH